MILKAVIMSLALVAGSSALHEIKDDDLDTVVSADEVATVVWDYFSQQNCDANDSVNQIAELTQKLKALFQESIVAVVYNQSFPEEIENDLVPFAIDLHKLFPKDLKRKKDEIQKELKDLQADMKSHSQEVKEKMKENVHLMQKQLEPYSNVLKDCVDSMSDLNAQIIKIKKELEKGLSDDTDGLTALMSSLPNKIKKHITKYLFELQSILMALEYEIKKTISQSMMELRRSLIPFVKDTQKLEDQLEGLSFQLKKEVLQLMANLSARIQEVWKQLDPLPEAMLKDTTNELTKSLTELNSLVVKQAEEFQHKVSPYIGTFNKVMVQKVEEFGQKLAPHASYMDDHLIFLEKDLKDKVMSFFHSLKENPDLGLSLKIGKAPTPNPYGAGTESHPLEQSST
ncbi:apolipoprotein A-IV-like [Suncus etruscus]|uniref:apolipoprotein A-IV-like n=1 Tax=Suncus etruscus TaxID=109475 RepID=UPI002110DF54|nr:apolipoprotein A-IV-like [Suncus etruscus]